MRSTISLAASLALPALLLLAACNPRDSSVPAANSAAQKQTPAASTNSAAATPVSTPAPQKPAASPAASPAAAHPDGIRRMTIQEARAAADSGGAVIYDVRNKESYAAGHIKGARLVAYDEVEQHLSEFPKDKLIITYCA